MLAGDGGFPAWNVRRRGGEGIPEIAVVLAWLSCPDARATL